MKNTTSKKANRPPSKVTRKNQPNIELMAKAIINLYNHSQKIS